MASDYDQVLQLINPGYIQSIIKRCRGIRYTQVGGLFDECLMPLTAMYGFLKREGWEDWIRYVSRTRETDGIPERFVQGLFKASNTYVLAMDGLLVFHFESGNNPMSQVHIRLTIYDKDYSGGSRWPIPLIDIECGTHRFGFYDNGRSYHLGASDDLIKLEPMKYGTLRPSDIDCPCFYMCLGEETQTAWITEKNVFVFPTLM